MIYDIISDIVKYFISILTGFGMFYLIPVQWKAQPTVFLSFFAVAFAFNTLSTFEEVERK